MKILNIELANVEQTDSGFEHWVDVTYSVPILKNKYTVRLLLLFDFEIEDDKVIEYLVTDWKYRELVLHSVRMYEMEKSKSFSILD
ncbi:DUF7720 family protein [Streptococcus pseudopneumoniae]|uniref:DUF7720 family protein n=1 Tax=Streptococcus pseudopneumoniae TaxID=257758 RepID=UPI00066DB74A|nr:hypothetical protein [Streptococcus pseudopneumoniae]